MWLNKSTEGHSPMPLTPSTRDEIGQLTSMFNLMTHSLQERNLAITANMATIKHQVGQLTTLHQVSAAIVRTLDLNQLLNTILQLLIANLGFTRMLLMLRHRERDTAYVAQIAGVSPDIAEAARHLDMPIQNDGSLQADLLIHGKPLLILNLEAVADRVQPPMLELARRAGVTSFVAVPLQSQNQMLGYLAADRGSQPCTDEDLHMLMTIASHVAAAIDNARAYSHLEELTQHLEQRIAERTQELSIANERLQEHDRRRSLFLSVASHELRTPMTVIRSFADNMRDGIAGPVSEQQLTYLTRIGHNLNRLTRIINQLLDWSRLDIKRKRSASHRSASKPRPSWSPTVYAPSRLKNRLPSRSCMRMGFQRSRGTAINWNRFSGISSAMRSSLRRQAAASPSISRRPPRALSKPVSPIPAAGLTQVTSENSSRSFPKCRLPYPPLRGLSLASSLPKAW